MKIFSILVFMFFSTSAFSGANTSFTQTGVISEGSGHSDTIIINDIAYRIDSNTNVHALVRHGELGPQLPAGELIGFNTKNEENSEQPYVTEIWLLNAN